MASTVYFMDDRTNSLAENTTFKTIKLIYEAGLSDLFSKGDTVGIKVYMGGHGSPFNIKPQWVKAIIEEIQKLGGKPVLVDCISMEDGIFSHISTKEDYLHAAARNGFSEETMDCPIWIADGDYGFEDAQVTVPKGSIMKHTYIGKKLLELDACIVISHLTGHELIAYSGAVFNVGFGMASRLGKITNLLLNHLNYGIYKMAWNQVPAKLISQIGIIKRKPNGNKFATAEKDEVTVMDRLIKSCPFGALEWFEDKLNFYKEKCKNCGACFFIGFFSDTLHPNPEMYALWPLSIADSASAYINAIGKDNFLYLNYATDITPWSEYMPFNDKPMLPNLGIFTSRDPIAVDMACLEEAGAIGNTPGSIVEEIDNANVVSSNKEIFTYVSSKTQVSQWAQINAGVYNGLGSNEYLLVKSETDCSLEYWLPSYYSSSEIDNYRTMLVSGDYDAGNYSHEQPKLSIIESFTKPKGKIEK